MTFSGLAASTVSEAASQRSMDIHPLSRNQTMILVKNDLYDLVTLFHSLLYTDCETVPCVVSCCIKYENKSDVVLRSLRPAEYF